MRLFVALQISAEVREQLSKLRVRLPERRAPAALEASLDPSDPSDEPRRKRHGGERLREDGENLDHGAHHTAASAMSSATLTYTR